MKRARNISTTANAPNRAHAQTKFVKDLYGNAKMSRNSIFVDPSCMQLALTLTLATALFCWPFHLFSKKIFLPAVFSMRGNVTSFSPCASHRSLLIGYCFVLLTFFFVFKEYFPSGPLKPKHNFLRAKDSSKVAFRRVKNYVRLFRSGRRTSCTKIERKYA